MVSAIRKTHVGRESSEEKKTLSFVFYIPEDNLKKSPWSSGHFSWIIKNV